MDLVCKEDGTRERKFTLYSGGQEWVFDTPKEVLGYVKQHPERNYTIYLGTGVGLKSPDIEELREEWRA